MIGGGDTGTNCVGTSMHHSSAAWCSSSCWPKPPLARAADNPWPQWPKVYKMDYGQEEAAAVFGDDPREYLIQTRQFAGEREGRVQELHTVRVEWVRDNGRPVPPRSPGRSASPGTLVLFAMGFRGPENQLLNQLGVEKDAQTNAKAEHGKFATSVAGVFAAGDMQPQARAWWCGRSTRAAAPPASATAG